MEDRDPDLTDVCEAWQWLTEHPYFFLKGKWADKCWSGFEDSYHIMVVKVDPEMDEISDDPAKNVMTQVWLECGPYADDEQHCHDIQLDCGAPTFEDAVLKLARLVMEQHGDYPEYRVCSHCLRNRPAGPTDPNEHWFCTPECEAHGDCGFRTEPTDHGTHRYISPREYLDCEHWQ